ncbi:cold-shock protein [Myxococcus qinghaiensis]|uniref:cold-shock protein n=1 Tax=Myxococcus qinghaiensis TaxID=2906758 RepID=UPI0020A8267D|nr:cold-shock protein [Myxococcus qinghaiensis]MCP3167232.1 cold-shock protein [Myxococcus qinghaiensis]
MQTGTVKFYNETKGFGFITPDEGGSDVFVHVSGLDPPTNGTLRENDKVEFEVKTERKGKMEANVRHI